MATYYISNTGNDSAAGTSEGTAWLTVAKVNTISLQPGDYVLFEAGGVWRETLNADPGTSGEGNRVYYGRYGTGINPRIIGSNLAITWTEATTNIWQSATTLSNPRTGPMGLPSEIFFVKDDVISWGDFQTYDASFTALTKEYDWTWYANVVYVYATSDPDTRYDFVEVPQRDLCIYALNTASSYIEFDGIDMLHGRVQGFGLSYAEVPNATDLTFKNLSVSYIGEKNGSAAYGIEAFHSNFLVDNCSFSDVGRRSISYNMYVTSAAAGGDVIINNVVVRNSTFKHGFHTTSLDLAMEPAPNCVGFSIQNVYFYNNFIDDSESDIRSVGSNQIFTQEGGGYINNVYIYNNIFKASVARSILIEGGDNVYIWNNTILGHNLNIVTSRYSNVTLSCLAADYRNNINYDPFPATLTNYGVLMDDESADYQLRDNNLYFQEYVGTDPGVKGFTGGIHGFFNTSQWADYLEANPTFDANSPSPSNPLFTDYENGDYTLTAESPANSAGTPIALVTTDILGNLRDATNPSIGAYEYGGIPAPTFAFSLSGFINKYGVA